MNKIELIATKLFDNFSLSKESLKVKAVELQEAKFYASQLNVNVADIYASIDFALTTKKKNQN